MILRYPVTHPRGNKMSDAIEATVDLFAIGSFITAVYVLVVLMSGAA